MTDLAGEVRRFNRFYTRAGGILGESLLGSDFSLTEARVLYELAQGGEISAVDLKERLNIDAGYLSRMLKQFERRGLIRREPAPADRRRAHVVLTGEGQAAFAALDRRSQQAAADLLQPLAPQDQARLVQAMVSIQQLLAPPGAARRPVMTLRPHRPGDMGWVIGRHGALYAQEYGWDETFEAFVAEIAARFIQQFDPVKERCWIAELAGERVGCIFLVKDSDAVAKLRMLLVDPAARGHGLGRTLVAECLAFARDAGYARVRLWTNDILHAARKLYVDAGFRLTETEHHRSFGQDLVGQTWELDL
ncbi:GNAT family N-acetyltransferase [Oleomonas cavernae]|uniref:GNAT family N-acetyltransferase n=1 Tax=Oleomonas cavernae TaxID=2320859 RepID=A0A418WT00_9PROT|nr:bifunctional helix-turn-helix transcriptional regulator/GNAT family N-acetyltransferase [Oleomonas cavernae]RJF94355.1 GNAT family N-acetyltransferase [Oleomonas cavernae]